MEWLRKGKSAEEVEVRRIRAFTTSQARVFSLSEYLRREHYLKVINDLRLIRHLNSINQEVWNNLGQVSINFDVNPVLISLSLTFQAVRLLYSPKTEWRSHGYSITFWSPDSGPEIGEVRTSLDVRIKTDHRVWEDRKGQVRQNSGNSGEITIIDYTPPFVSVLSSNRPLYHLTDKDAFHLVYRENEHPKYSISMHKSFLSGYRSKDLENILAKTCYLRAKNHQTAKELVEQGLATIRNF